MAGSRSAGRPFSFVGHFGETVVRGFLPQAGLSHSIRISYERFASDKNADYPARRIQFFAKALRKRNRMGKEYAGAHAREESRTTIYVHHDIRASDSEALHSRGFAGLGSRHRPRSTGRTALHARNSRDDASRAFVDHAAIRGIWRRRGYESTVSLFACARAVGPLDRVRPPNFDGLRLGSSPFRRRSRKVWRGD